MEAAAAQHLQPARAQTASKYASYWFLYQNIYTGTTPRKCNYIGIKVLYTSIDYEINKLIYTAVTAFTLGYLYRLMIPVYLEQYKLCLQRRPRPDGN